MGSPLSVTLAMACPRRPLQRKSAVGYHAAMRWILPVVLLAACAGASKLPTADPPATDDLSGLISQPAPGWKLDHWFNSDPLALQDLRGKVVLVRWFMAPSCPFCSATAPASCARRSGRCLPDP